MKSGLLVCLGLYAISCCLPALEWRKDQSGPDIMLGLRALAVGWSGLFAGVTAWYANPVWLVGLALLAFRRTNLAAAAGVVALLIGLTVFRDIDRELPGDEGNVTKTAIVRVLPGAYMWFASLAALPVAAWLQRGR